MGLGSCAYESIPSENLLWSASCWKRVSEEIPLERYLEDSYTPRVHSFSPGRRL